jgi:uncharacterized protein
MTTNDSLVDSGGPVERGPLRARDHRGTAVLSLQECLGRLSSTTIGRVAFVHAGSVVILPVNFVVDGLGVVFRSAYGSKLQLAEDSAQVGFEADGYDARSGAGWSVLVQGFAQVVDDPVAVTRFNRLGLRSALPDDGSVQWIRIRADEITGREIAPPDPAAREATNDPAGDA